jgi:hypothetical protein
MYLPRDSSFSFLARAIRKAYGGGLILSACPFVHRSTKKKKKKNLLIITLLIRLLPIFPGGSLQLFWLRSTRSLMLTLQKVPDDSTALGGEIVWAIYSHVSETFQPEAVAWPQTPQYSVRSLLCAKPSS